VHNRNVVHVVFLAEEDLPYTVFFEKRLTCFCNFAQTSLQNQQVCIIICI